MSTQPLSSVTVAYIRSELLLTPMAARAEVQDNGRKYRQIFPHVLAVKCSYNVNISVAN